MYVRQKHVHLIAYLIMNTNLFDVAHFIEPLLKNTALGTLSIGFLFNLLMTYIIMLISRLASKIEKFCPSKKKRLN